MTNLLNSILANQSIKSPAQQTSSPAFTFSTEGKVKPLDDKAKLLPSRIFGSPIEYVKDLKQDVINIGRAVKGQANDHELGRINDLAMKMGSLALAGYLFCKTPGKLAKVMEFVGFGTFFGSMALWPKLAIQAPLKARTGVDIHQKYVDSQGRKKMLMQDPQYDLTDLYSQEDLDKIGKKTKVNENLPDRNRFVKQRAKKIATQGNTLWMLTAGGAPLMSAIACNLLEKPLAKGIELHDLKSTQKAVDRLASTGSAGGFVSSLKQKAQVKVVEKFLQDNADKVVDDALAVELSKLIKTSDASVQTVFEKQLKELGKGVKVDLNEESVSSAIKSILSKLEETGAIVAGVDVNKLVADNAAKIKEFASSPSSVATVLTDSLDLDGNVIDFYSLNEQLSEALEKASIKKPTLGEISKKVKSMQASVLEFVQKKNVLDNFKRVRIGKSADSYIAHQWNDISDTLINQLKFTPKELKKMSRGNAEEILSSKLTQLAKNPEEYDKVVSKLVSMVSDYERKLGSEFVSTVSEQTQRMSAGVKGQLASDGFEELAKHFGDAAKGTIESVTKGDVKDRIAGAKSSFYRVLQTLDFFKRAESAEFKTQVKSMIEATGKQADDALVEKYIAMAKKILFEATDTTYIEKLRTTGFENILSKAPVSKEEYDVLMKMLFDVTEGSGKTLEGKADDVVNGFKTYMNDMIHVVKKYNPFNTEVSGFGDAIKANGDAQGKDIGKQIINYFKDSADKAFNSKKWLAIFGTAFGVLTIGTLVATLFIGKKSKMEEQAEQDLKLNG